MTISSFSCLINFLALLRCLLLCSKIKRLKLKLILLLKPLFSYDTEGDSNERWNKGLGPWLLKNGGKQVMLVSLSVKTI